AGENIVRYEELIADEQRAFRRIFDLCRIDLSEARRRDVVEANSFERQTGRRRGQEDVAAHHRKGIEGDWKNHFTARLKAAVKDRFGMVLIETGYETDLNW